MLKYCQCLQHLEEKTIFDSQVKCSRIVFLYKEKKGLKMDYIQLESTCFYKKKWLHELILYVSYK